MRRRGGTGDPTHLLPLFIEDGGWPLDRVGAQRQCVHTNERRKVPRAHLARRVQGDEQVTDGIVLQAGDIGTMPFQRLEKIAGLEAPNKDLTAEPARGQLVPAVRGPVDKRVHALVRRWHERAAVPEIVLRQADVGTTGWDLDRGDANAGVQRAGEQALDRSSVLNLVGGGVGWRGDRGHRRVAREACTLGWLRRLEQGRLGPPLSPCNRSRECSLLGAVSAHAPPPLPFRAR
eukprot:scaffold1922_cov101-Isochrysis_galbana.AAC.6